ncbi:N-acetyltransferase family protein [Leptolyngbya sp. AN02str]|uniref:GNAT family N-acetyltransferase n=1 Tax=Leptolyngbya sp. AN02str TaxID=3423363 RepID=UPI003D31664D
MNPFIANGHLRDAALADLPHIVEIYNASIPGRMATADTDPVSVESRLIWFQEHHPQTRPIWVLERQGRIIAWISLSTFYGRPAYQGTAEFSLYIAPECQGQGIGTQLLQCLIERCPEFGVTTVLGFIFGHNTPSLRLSEKAGFERWGFLPGVAVLDGKLCDLVIMGRRV